MMIPAYLMVWMFFYNNAKIANIVQIYCYFCPVKKLNDIIQPIAVDLQRFETYFEHTLKAETAPMNAILNYVRETRGKRVRPILVLLSAKAFGAVGEKTLRVASFVELVHTATLIHDDVVDDSDQRRGKASVKSRFGNLPAVLAGDYLLAKAMMLIANDADILNETLRTTMTMSEGELMQNQRNGGDYLDIITRKTAMLMRSCCVVGAMSVGATERQVQQISDFGLNFGILFQLRDDLLDGEFTTEAQTLLPEYKKKTLEALQAFPDSEIRKALHELTLFCAEREE